MSKLFSWFQTVCVLLLHTGVFAQESSSYTHPSLSFRKGLELYQRGLYGDAQKMFEKVHDELGPGTSQYKSDAEFYRAMCAIELTNDDAEFLIGSFINNYPESQKVNEAYFEMGKLRYGEKKYHNALYWFEKIDRNALSSDKKSEFQFMTGYSEFSINNYDAANKAFYDIKDTDNKYASPATYYYSHIAYQQKKYATALKGFQKLQDDPTFSPVVPFYITQIYYLQLEWEKVTEYAPKLLESATTKRTPEIARLLGESYYRLRQFDKAIQYLDQYQLKAPSITREDYYLLGFAYYRNNNYADAAKYLERVATEDDSLSQNANYHLADCYLKLNDKNKARQAFLLASRSNSDQVITEDALFNFAKITYELLYSPFNDAIEAFQQYINQFPNSKRIDEAYNYLVLAHMNTRNYKDALASLDKIQNLDASTKQAYQRVAFFRGLELFQNLNYSESIEKFNLSLKYPDFNKTIYAQTLYWQAEAYYRTGNYEKAADDYNQFILSPGAFGLPEFNLAHYNLGYSYFKQKKFDDAIVWFRKYTNLCRNDKTQFVGDALNRIGDSFFIQRHYWAAVDYYDQAAAVNAIDADYATFQTGFSLGLVDRPQKKNEYLIKLINNYPSSNYLDDAVFELAESYMVLKQPQDAIKQYLRIKNEFQGSSYYIKSLVQLGLIYYNNDNPDSSMIFYKRVVEEFPGTPEAKNALTGIRNIYVDKGEADAYFTYSSQLGSFANIGLTEKDSISYISAEKLYMSGDCSKSIPALTGYINSYPQGSFSLNANFYLGDCYQKAGRYDEAINAFNQVIQRQKNAFSEQAVRLSSQIYFTQKNYEKALETYDLLENLAEVKTNLQEARMGKLRSSYALNRSDEVIAAAAKVLQTEKIPAEDERAARFMLALTLLKINKTDEALDEFVKISGDPKSLEGAESRFHMVEIYLNKKDYEKAEKEVFAFAEKNTPHQFWLAKSFILLADVYEAQDDFFQAKATLQSVIDGYSVPDDGIIDLATGKLNELVKKEKSKQLDTKRDTVRFHF